MIGLDTNVLVRYLTQDEPRQAAAASRAIEEAVDAGEACFLSTICMCELVWVLDAAYGYRREQIVNALRQILSTRHFEFESKDLLWQSLNDYATGGADFADHVIGRTGREAGCETTLSFDRSLRDEPRFQLLS